MLDMMGLRSSRMSQLLLLLLCVAQFSTAQTAPPAPPAAAQTADPNAYGYSGYKFNKTGGNETAYITDNVNSDNIMNSDNVTANLSPVPDVFLNASAHVGEISLVVENITVKVNLDAQVLKLLTFNAGVQASIDRVRLLIQGVEAKVLLEARLENIVAMVSDVLHAIDLKPILATLTKDVNHIVNNAVDTLAGPMQPPPGTANTAGHKLKKRADGSFVLEHNILYSVNDYQGNAHTNRILAQDGSIADIFLDNQGHEHGHVVIGYYARDMSYTGVSINTTFNGQNVRELRYLYTPLIGIEDICGIYVDGNGLVQGTRIVAEVEGGGNSTIE